MALTQSDVDEHFDNAGNVVKTRKARRDITVPAVTYDLHVKLRAFLDLPDPTPQDTARAVVALARLVVGDDLLTDNKGA